MNNPIHDRPTWVHFQLSSPLPVLELARLVESEILSAGFTRVGMPGSGRGAGSALANGQAGKSGESILDVIPENGILLSSASMRFRMLNSDLEISFRIGEPNTPSFGATTNWDNFTLRVNYMMDHNRLRWFAETITDEEELGGILREPKIAYRLVKQLFNATGTEKCIGVDDKSLTGEYFTDRAGFFFSRTEPEILSELLEEPVDPAN